MGLTEIINKRMRRMRRIANETEQSKKVNNELALLAMCNGCYIH